MAIVGSRRMSEYGKKVIGVLMRETEGSAERVTIKVAGCNSEVINLGAEKIFVGTDFDKINEEAANYADILIVIEGSKRSGTILLAEKFVEKGKTVYAVPGRIGDPGSEAPNWLIAQGAEPIINISEFVPNYVTIRHG